ncbi:histidine kinase [bacterium]|nr:histidine kinase [bacterium]
MRFRIRDILIVSSLYDFYVFEEEGRLYELLRSEYQGLNLSHTPELTRVSNAVDAIEHLRHEHRYDFVIVTLHIEDLSPVEFAKLVKKENIDIPIVLLASENRELSDIINRKEDKLFDEVFVWLGNYRLLLAIIKSIEDKYNVKHDTRIMGVQSIIFIEDNIRYYSAFLPSIYLEVMKQSQRLIKEGLNLSHKNLRQRARPKILLCTNYEDADSYYQMYKETVLGVISDIDFPMDGARNPEAGLLFAGKVKSETPDIPILLHSSRGKNSSKARECGCDFLLKDSPSLLKDLGKFMEEKLGFGDFNFQMPDGTVIGRAHDIISLEKELKNIPSESFAFHAERNHFSNWLKARTEFWLAHKLRPRRIAEFPSIDATRKHLIRTLREYRRLRRRGIITEFNPENFDTETSISRIGGGSLGGKARGLSFINRLMNNYNIIRKFKDVKIFIPPAVVLTTDVFDEFIEKNNLKNFALKTKNDQKILNKFLQVEYFPEDVLQSLKSFLKLIKKPLAVRSSSLLEDSHNYPFAGVYETYMLPNSNMDLRVRLKELVNTVKRVYASTFFRGPRDYLKATSFRLEEEKMAIVIQVLSGREYGDRFYPTFSGTAQSYNFYAMDPQKSEDGTVSVSLGLGKMVVEGGRTVRFSPKHPKHILQFSTIDLALKNNQNEFFALDLSQSVREFKGEEDEFIKSYSIKDAEKDGVLQFIASTYSAENDRLYDGLRPGGYPVLTFSPVLKSGIFPLPEIIEMFLDLGTWSMATPVEIEFAVNIPLNPKEKKEFSILQIRPMALNREDELLDVDNVESSKLISRSNKVFGNGIVEDVFDIVVVDRDLFDRSKSREVALEVSKFNSMLIKKGRPYLLIGVGRWGSMDPWLGIPVKWDQISGARAIVESSFKDFSVSPSQGSHFFENLISFAVSYFTIQDNDPESFLDWDWIKSNKSGSGMKYTKLITFKKPIILKMNGHEKRGIIYKPGFYKKED